MSETRRDFGERSPYGGRSQDNSFYEEEVFINGAYLNRFSEPVSLAEARIDIVPPGTEVFTVRIGEKDYPVIPDYSKSEHFGEEIDFGDDIRWKVEGYVVCEWSSDRSDYFDVDHECRGAACRSV